MEEPTTLCCLVCGQEFATTQQLELHRREQHPRMNVALAYQLQQQDAARFEGNGEVF